MSRHEPRQRLAREFGATHVIAERGDDGVDAVKDLTDGVGADAVLECVGTDESMIQALRSVRPGGRSAASASRTASSCPSGRCSVRNVGLRGGPAPVRQLPARTARAGLDRRIDPGKVFDLELPLDRGRRGLPRHGRAQGDQGATAPLSGSSSKLEELLGSS